MLNGPFFIKKLNIFDGLNSFPHLIYYAYPHLICDPYPLLINTADKVCDLLLSAVFSERLGEDLKRYRFSAPTEAPARHFFGIFDRRDRLFFGSWRAGARLRGDSYPRLCCVPKNLRIAGAPKSAERLGL